MKTNKELVIEGVKKSYNPNEPRDEKGQWTAEGDAAIKQALDASNDEGTLQADAAQRLMPGQPEQHHAQSYQEAARHMHPSLAGKSDSEIADRADRL